MFDDLEEEFLRRKRGRRKEITVVACLAGVVGTLVAVAVVAWN